MLKNSSKQKLLVPKFDQYRDFLNYFCVFEDLYHEQPPKYVHNKF